MISKKFNYKISVFLVYLCMFFEGSSLILFSATKDNIMQVYQITAMQYGLLVSIRSISGGIFPFICGMLSDRLGKKIIIFVGAILFLIYFYVLSTASSFYVLLLLMILFGIAYSCTDPVSQSILFDAFKNPTRAMPFVQVAFAGGSFSAPLVVAWLMNRQYQWTINHLIYALFPCIMILILLTTKLPEKKNIMDIQEAIVYSRTPKFRKEGLFVFLFCATNAMISATINNWSDVYMKIVYGFSSAQAIQTISYFQLGCMIGAFVMFFVSKKVHTSDILIRNTLGTFIFLLLALLFHHAFFFILCIFIIGIFTGTLFSLSVGYVGQLFPHSSGAAVGLAASATALGMALISFFTGKFIDILGVRNIFIILLLVMALTHLLTRVIKFHYQQLTTMNNQ